MNWATKGMHFREVSRHQKGRNSSILRDEAAFGILGLHTNFQKRSGLAQMVLHAQRGPNKNTVVSFDQEPRNGL